MSNLQKSITLITIIVLIPIIGAVLLCMVANKAQENEKNNAVENSVRIVTVGKCEYVLWHNGYGSDMEHYESCQCRRVK